MPADLLQGRGAARLKPVLGVRYEFGAGQGLASFGAHSVCLRQHVPLSSALGLEVRPVSPVSVGPVALPDWAGAGQGCELVWSAAGSGCC